MSHIDKLLGIIAFGQRVYDKRLLRQLLSGAIFGLALTIVTAIMISALLIGSLVEGYVVLLHHGTDPGMATVLMGIAAIVVVGFLVVLLLMYLRHLRRLPRTLFQQLPLMPEAMDALDAFSAGFMAEPVIKKESR